MSRLNLSPTSRAALMLLSFFMLGLIGLAGAAELVGTGLTAPDNFSAFQKKLVEWDEDSRTRYIVTTYTLVCLGCILAGALGFVLSFVNWLIIKTKE